MNNSLMPGDRLITLRDEKDIEIVPAGTVVTLQSRNGPDLWYCLGVVNGKDRILLIVESNLTTINSC